MIQNVITVDVEDYFHVEAFTGVISRQQWDSFPSRVECNTKRLLDLFDECGVKATCFVLGWIADKHPALVREIAQRGHEIGSHSYWHRLIYTLTPDEFRVDTIRSREAIQQAVGQRVNGYRAPSFSITARSLWALDILVEEGFTFDSSIFPVQHPTYGIRGAPRLPFRVRTESGDINEFPMPAFRLGKLLNLPVAGGGYLRMLPSWYTRLGIHQLIKEKVPVVCYIHPWEVDPEQPRIQAPLKSRIRHYTNLAKTAGRLREMLRSFPFTSFRDSGLTTEESLQAIQLYEERQYATGGAILERYRPSV